MGRGCRRWHLITATLLLLALAAACGSGSGGRVRVTGAEEPWTSVVAFGDSIFGVEGSPTGAQHVVRSSTGATWERIELPEEPEQVQFGQDTMTTVGDVLTVTGRGLAEANAMDVPIGTFRAWSTSDGRRWTASPAIDDVAAFVHPRVRGLDGVLLIGLSTQDGRFHLLRGDGTSWEPVQVSISAEPGVAATLTSLWPEDGAMSGLVTYSNTGLASSTAPPPTIIRSADRGMSWTTRDCATTDASECGAVEGSDTTLLVRGRTSSTDGGETWTAIRFDPEVGTSCPPILLRSIIDAPDDRSGWVGVASIETGGPTQVLLLHSDDGVTWRTTTGERCPSPSLTISDYTDPVAHDDALWTVRTSGTEEAGTSAAAVLRSTDGRSWEPVAPALDGDSTFSSPIIHGGRLLVPIYDGLHRLTELRSHA